MFLSSVSITGENACGCGYCLNNADSQGQYIRVFIQSKEMHSRIAIKTSVSICRGVVGQMGNVFKLCS